MSERTALDIRKELASMEGKNRKVNPARVEQLEAQLAELEAEESE